MNLLKEVYHWSQAIHQRLPLSKWNALGLALMSVGMIRSEHNWVSKIAENLVPDQKNYETG